MNVDPNILNFLGYAALGSLAVWIVVSAITFASRWVSLRSRQRAEIADLGESLQSSLGYVQSHKSNELSARVGRWVERLVDNPRYGARLRQKLLMAGFFNPNAVAIFLSARIGFSLLLPVVIAVAMQFFAGDAHPAFVLGLPVAVAVVGLFLPDYYVSRRTRRYEDECRRGFPDFLDLLVVATDAGMGLEQAIGRVGGEIIRNYPGLGANIYLMTLELRMGRGFSEALNNLVNRTNVSEIKSFATLLQQSRELGSSVTAALRIYSEDMRHKRMSNAEEKAHALPVKMVIPLAVFLFPVIILIVMLPVIIRIGEAFSKMSN